MIIEYPFYMAYKKTTCILCSLQAKKKEEERRNISHRKGFIKRALVMTKSKL